MPRSVAINSRSMGLPACMTKGLFISIISKLSTRPEDVLHPGACFSYLASLQRVVTLNSHNCAFAFHSFLVLFLFWGVIKCLQRKTNTAVFL